MHSREWLASLEQFGVKLGLDTISRLLDTLGNPERAAAVVHVAGTNGKGSVAAMTAAALDHAGLRTGLYTSPHLVRLEERFVVGGRQIDPASLDEALDEVRRAVTTLQQDGSLTVHPTYFEVTTAAAFLLFARAGVQVAVVEVGLGGRFDATNVVRPDVVAIVSVDLDHERQLGATIAEVAAEKAGIIKPGAALVVGRLPAEAERVVDAAAAAAGVAPRRGRDATVDVEAAGGSCAITVRTASGTYGPVRLALAGRHQVDNAVVAVLALEALAERGHRIPASAVEAGLSSARWPGRLQWIEDGDGQILIDGAHNPAGARALASYLLESGLAPLPLVFGVMQDKAVDGMLAALAPVARPLIATRAPGSRALDAESLARHAASFGIDVVAEPDPVAALARARQGRRPVAVAGSLFLAGAVLEHLGRAPE